MKLKITQTKSTIACLKNHIANIQALGLHHVGDTVIIMAYAFMTPEEAKTFKPAIVFPVGNKIS